LIGVPVVKRLNNLPPALDAELYIPNSEIDDEPVKVSLLANDTAPVNVQAVLVAVVNPVVPKLRIVAYPGRLLSFDVGAVLDDPMATADNTCALLLGVSRSNAQPRPLAVTVFFLLPRPTISPVTASRSTYSR
jgi:hypothetical protein